LWCIGWKIRSKGSHTPGDIMLVKSDGEITGPHKPSIEYPFYQAIYQIRPDLKAVVHAHPPALVSFSIVRQIPNTNLIPQAKNVCGPIGYAKYRIPGSKALGDEIADQFAMKLRKKMKKVSMIIPLTTNCDNRLPNINLEQSKDNGDLTTR